MTIVFTNAPANEADLHVPERKYIPEGAEVIIATYDPTGDNTVFYEQLGKADIVINYYVYLGRKEIDTLQAEKEKLLQKSGK